MTSPSADTMTLTDERLHDLTRPIIGIENRTSQEAFDIMCDRIRSALLPHRKRNTAAQPASQMPLSPWSLPND